MSSMESNPSAQPIARTGKPNLDLFGSYWLMTALGAKRTLGWPGRNEALAEGDLDVFAVWRAVIVYVSDINRRK